MGVQDEYLSALGRLRCEVWVDAGASSVWLRVMAVDLDLGHGLESEHGA